MKRCGMAVLLALLVTLTACGMGNTPAPEGGEVHIGGSDTAAGRVEAVPSEDGNTVGGGSYTNAAAAIACTLDESWLFYNSVQLAALNGLLTDGEDPEALAALAESGAAVYDMYAVSADGLLTINVTYQHLGLLSGVTMSAEAYAEQAAAQLPAALMAYGFTEVEAAVAPVAFAGEESCPAVTVTALLEETPLYELVVCRKAENYVFCVTLCSFTEDVTGEMAALFTAAE